MNDPTKPIALTSAVFGVLSLLASSSDAKPREKAFQLALEPARVEAKVGTSASAVVKITRTEDTGAIITVKAVRPPAGARLKPVKVPADQETVALSLDVASTMLPGGPFPIQLNAVGGGARQTASLAVRVVPSDATGTWLDRLNTHRALAKLPPAVEEPEWSDGCYLHTRYMIKNQVGEHDETQSNPWFSEAGLACAKSADLGLDLDLHARDEAGVDGLMAGPFHGVQLIDPGLSRTAFASYREKAKGPQMASAIDTVRGRGAVPASVKFPVTYPADGTSATLATLSEGEWPASITSCSGFTAPLGAPIFFMAGGTTAPSVSQSRLTVDGKDVRHCRYDEVTYTNPVAYDQQYGRDILALRHTVILLPAVPLAKGSKATVQLTANGKTTTWSFTMGGG